MPSLYFWLGFRFFFFSHEHEPIHIHVEIENRQTVFELIVVNGVVTDIVVRSIAGYDMLSQKEQKKAMQLIRKYKKDILQKWIDFFVLNKPIKTKNIRTKTP